METTKDGSNVSDLLTPVGTDLQKERLQQMEYTNTQHSQYLKVLTLTVNARHLLHQIYIFCQYNTRF